MIGVVVFGLFPVFYCILHYMNDVIDYIQLDDDIDVEDTEIKVWQVTYFVVLSMYPKSEALISSQNLPYGLLWYGFAFAAIQVHGFSLVFAWNLTSAWKSRGSKKTQ